jgi:hypothetical protein
MDINIGIKLKLGSALTSFDRIPQEQIPQLGEHHLFEEAGEQQRSPGAAEWDHPASQEGNRI